MEHPPTALMMPKKTIFSGKETASGYGWGYSCAVVLRPVQICP